MVLFGRRRQTDRRHLLASSDSITLDHSAVDRVRDSLDGADDTDLLFLRSLMDSPVVRGLVKVQDRLESSVPPQPVNADSAVLRSELSTACGNLQTNSDAQELAQILHNPHLQALLESHDQVADTKASPPSPPKLPPAPHPSTMASAIRVLGLRKNPDEPLGLTVQVDETTGCLCVARILADGVIDRQGLLNVGDQILELNGEPVTTPEELQAMVATAADHITLKVGPGPNMHGNSGVGSGRCYLRAHFKYDPSEDSLLPCKQIGLAFNPGDILRVLDQTDPIWWQASFADNQDGQVGLIPSQELEERRKAFVKPEADYVHKISMCGTRVSKKKRRAMYQSKSSAEFDKAELILYEEVTRMPPFRRRTLALIGSQGVGRRTLKNRLINSDCERFGGVVPYTSRPPRVLEEDGKGYHFIERPAMEDDIREHKFLEYGEHNGHLYGTKLDSIRDIIRQGKMCILDCSPPALKLLHNSSEFMPYVIFIAAPGMEQLKHLYGVGSQRNLNFDRASSIRYSSRRARTLESLASLYEEDDLRRTLEDSSCLQRTYEKFIDLVIVNEDFDITFRKVVEALEALSTEHQWVPVNWVY